MQDIVREIQDQVDQVKVFYLDEFIDSSVQFDCEVERISIRQLHKLEEFDIVHTHMLRPDFLGSLLVKSGKVKLATVHNYMFDDLANTHGRFVARIVEKIWITILKRFTAVVCLTYDMKNYYQHRGLEKSNVLVVQNGRPQPVTKKFMVCKEISLLRDKGLFILVVSAMLSPRKGIEQLVKALPHLPKVGLAIIGDGPEKSNLENLANQLEVIDRCVFLGFKDHPTDYYGLVDAFAMPSRSEGFPLAMIEAAAVGLPLLVSDLPLFREILSPDEAVFAPLDDVHGMIKSISYVVEHKQQLAQQALTAYENRFTSKSMAERYLNIYHSLVG